MRTSACASSSLHARSAEIFASTLKDHPLVRETLGRIERAAGSPRTIMAIVDAVTRGDVRSAAPMISAPTLVVHCRDDTVIPREASQWLVDHIEGAQYVEIDGEHVVYDTDRFVEEVEAFLGVAEVMAVFRAPRFGLVAGANVRPDILWSAGCSTGRPYWLHIILCQRQLPV